MADSVIAYVALGSNLGDREASLDGAIARLRQQPFTPTRVKLA